MALPIDTELVETLGEGSFGTVYVARIKEGAIQRTVVLKVLKASWIDNEDILSRSKDEAALLARLNHDNIVKVEQLTTLQGRPAVVMEYVRGLTLDVIVKKSGAIPVGVVLQIVARVASALDAAYNKIPPGMDSPLRVVHRDIKPSNIILSVNGAVKVLDFGTARGEFGEREAETISVTLGSPRYMAPERFDGVNSGPAIDIYAMGVTFYELLGGRSMGRMPLNPDRHREKVDKALDALRPEKGGGKDLDELLNLIRDCLAYDHEARVGATEFRKRALKILSTLSGATITLDIFAETVVEPVWEERKKQPVIPLSQEDENLLKSPSASVSMVTGTRSGRSGLSGHSAASSIVVAAGGGRQVMLLLAGGLIAAVGGILFLKSMDKGDQPTLADPQEQISTPNSQNLAPGPITGPAEIAPEQGEEQEEEEEEDELPEAIDSSEATEPAPLTGSTSTTPQASSTPAARAEDNGPRVTITVGSSPSSATLVVGSERHALPKRGLSIPDRSQSVTIEFSDGATFDCQLEPVEGKAYFFRKDGSVCP